MNGLRSNLRYRLRQLGWPGITGVGLLSFCLAFFVVTLLPAQKKIAQVAEQTVSLREQIQNAARTMTVNRDAPAEQLVTYYQFFPTGRSSPDWLEKIYRAAQDQNIVLEQGEYRTGRDRAGPLIRYQITLPVKGTYVQLRTFLAAVLNSVPILSLDQIDFERQKVGDPTIDAKVKLTLYLGQES
jgi:Tfp pilus assembly protein PilO